MATTAGVAALLPQLFVAVTFSVTLPDVPAVYIISAAFAGEISVPPLIDQRYVVPVTASTIALVESPGQSPGAVPMTGEGRQDVTVTVAAALLTTPHVPATRTQ